MNVKEQIARMSLKEKLGQMFVVSVHGMSMEESTVQMLKEFSFGNVYLYNLNYVNPAALESYCRELKQVILNNTGILPLLSGTYEGGGMLRFGLYNVSIPYSDAIGEKNDPKISYLAGTLLGLQLRDLGLNFNWAPLLDVASTTGDSRLRERSYSQDASTAANIGVEMIHGMHDAGIGCAAKHFPGLGAFSLLANKGHFIGIKDDSFFVKNHIMPFNKAIESGVDAIVLGSFIESTSRYGYVVGNPAELCTFLRDELNYDGVITTDAIQNMKDIPALTVESLVNNAMETDVDLFTFGYDTRRQMQLFEQMYEKLEKGIIPESRIDRSVERILKMKDRLTTYDERARPARKQDKAKLLETLSKAVLEIDGSEETILSAANKVRSVVQVIMPYYREEDYVGFKRSLDCCLSDVLCSYAQELHAVYYDDNSFEEQVDRIADDSLLVVVCETFDADSGIGEWVLTKAKTHTVVCYVLAQNSPVKETYVNIVFAYLHSLSDASILAATKVLFGESGASSSSNT